MATTAAPSTPQQFATRFSSSAVSREGLIQALSDRFYVDEPGKLVSNGLSTEFIYFPSDLEPARRNYLKKKIHDVVSSYVSAFYDLEEIHALLRLPPTKPDFAPTLGLYLYFADECSRLYPQTTFLSELRKASITAKMIKGGEYYDRQGLYAKAMAMLNSLDKMGESHKKILTDWYETGHYAVNGQSHSYDGENLPGAYARLGRAIGKPNEVWSLNTAISYALGNKEHIQNMSAEEAYKYTNDQPPGLEANKSLHRSR